MQGSLHHLLRIIRSRRRGFIRQSCRVRAPSQLPGGVSRAPRRRGQLVPSAQAALAERHHSHRRIPARALHLQLRGDERGAAAYNDQVKFLTSLPFVAVLEWGFIFLPLLYHALYGFYIWYRGDSNVGEYPWTGNWLYTVAALDRNDRVLLHRVPRSITCASAACT